MLGINFSWPLQLTFIWGEEDKIKNKPKLKELKPSFYQGHLISFLRLLLQQRKDYLFFLQFFSCRIRSETCLSTCSMNFRWYRFPTPKQNSFTSLWWENTRHFSLSFSNKALLCLCFPLCSVAEDLLWLVFVECLGKWSFLGMQTFLRTILLFICKLQR